MRKIGDVALRRIRVKKMKPRILKFVVAALSIGWVVTLTMSTAQDLSSLGKQAGSLGDLSSIAQKLHLGPHQVQQVLPILQKEVPKLQAIKGNSSLSNAQKESQMKAVQQQSDSKLKPILSPDQLLSLKNFRAQQLQELLGGALPH